MSVLQSVLLEEINRLEKNIMQYSQLLSSLPRGSIFVRQIGNNSYVYRKRKECGKVVSEYLGSKEDKNVIRQIELSKEYKRTKENLRIANLELKKLKKACKTFFISLS